MTVRNSHNGGSSPPSSTDPDHQTGRETPSTNLTVMSPDTGYRASGPSYNSTNLILRSRDHELQLGTGMQYTNNSRLPDRVQTGRGLSPTARDFQPIRTPIPAPAARHGFGNLPRLVHREPRLQPRAGPARDESVANETSFPRTQATVLLSRCRNIQFGTFSTNDQSYRALMFSGLTLMSHHHYIRTMFSPARFPSLRGIEGNDAYRGFYKVAFNDARDARQAYALAVNNRLGNVLSWLKPRQLAASLGQEDVDLLTDHEGELIISLTPEHGIHTMTFGRFFELLDGCGDVKAIHWYDDNDPRFVSFRVEYHNVLSAESFKSRYHGVMIDDHRIEVYDHAPDVVPPQVTVTTSVTGRSVVAQADLDQLSHLMPRLMAPRNRIGHNHVTIERIQSGQDVRTTIMLRNIPNKITQDDLKRYLDKTSYGQYDFMYLRIDFANRCNVGYAFVNFIDPIVIINFARARSGIHWNVHESNKRAEISYATIQGCDCLIQKFRNSSVMLEDPSYRPKLFYTHPDRRAGRDKDFPDPDNFSKMRRSIENAEHIGLWIPSLGLTQPARVDNAPQHVQPSRQAIAPVPPAVPAAHRVRGQDQVRSAVTYYSFGPIAPVPQAAPTVRRAHGQTQVQPLNTHYPRLALPAVDVNAPNDPFAGRGRGPSAPQQPRRFH